MADSELYVFDDENGTENSLVRKQGERKSITRSLPLALRRPIISDFSTYMKKTDPNSIIPIPSFINYVETVEKAYPDDTPEDTVTRIRVHYYNGWAFERLIPQAHTYDVISFVDPEYGRVSSSRPRVLEKQKIGADAYKHLTAHADENATGDNPAPYIQLPNDELIDVGHVLLGLDALLHPIAGSPYTDYNVPNIDPASWVADLGLASVWMMQHKKTGTPPADAPKKLRFPNLKAYYQMSAPDADLLGDADSFGTHEQWIITPGQKLSQVLQAYYLGTPGTEARIKSRLQTFCVKNNLSYTRSGNTIKWSPTIRNTLVSRVNAFNDLASAGKVGAIWGCIAGPTKRAWPHTPQIIDMFLHWTKTHLEAELTLTSQ